MIWVNLNRTRSNFLWQFITQKCLKSQHEWPPNDGTFHFRTGVIVNVIGILFKMNSFLVFNIGLILSKHIVESMKIVLNVFSVKLLRDKKWIFSISSVVISRSDNQLAHFIDVFLQRLHVRTIVVSIRLNKKN